MLATFRAEAERDRRSLNSELLVRLERAAAELRRDEGALARRAELSRRLRAFVAAQKPFSLTADEISRITDEDPA